MKLKNTQKILFINIILLIAFHFINTFLWNKCNDDENFLTVLSIITIISIITVPWYIFRSIYFYKYLILIISGYFMLIKNNPELNIIQALFALNILIVILFVNNKWLEFGILLLGFMTPSVILNSDEDWKNNIEFKPDNYTTAWILFYTFILLIFNLNEKSSYKYLGFTIYILLWPSYEHFVNKNSWMKARVFSILLLLLILRIYNYDVNIFNRK